MKLDINEEEREFLEKICNLMRDEMRSQLQTATYIKYLTTIEKDLVCLYGIIGKLRELDANLMNKAMGK
jgi:hypothetical protein